MTEQKSVHKRVEDLKERVNELEDQFESIRRREDEVRMMDEYDL